MGLVSVVDTLGLAASIEVASFGAAGVATFSAWRRAKGVRVHALGDSKLAGAAHAFNDKLLQLPELENLAMLAAQHAVVPFCLHC